MNWLRGFWVLWTVTGGLLVFGGLVAIIALVSPFEGLTRQDKVRQLLLGVLAILAGCFVLGAGPW